MVEGNVHKKHTLKKLGYIVLPLKMKHLHPYLRNYSKMLLNEKKNALNIVLYANNN